MLDPGIAFYDVLDVLDADDLLALVVLDVLAVELRDLFAMGVAKVLAWISPNTAPLVDRMVFLSTSASFWPELFFTSRLPSNV